MLNKIKSSPNDSAKNQKGDQNESDQQPDKDGQSQEKSDSQQAQNGKQSSDSQDGSNSAPSRPSQEAQNGIGNKDGDKATKDAAALKAMGKITELLGKRAENVKQYLISRHKIDAARITVETSTEASNAQAVVTIVTPR